MSTLVEVSIAAVSLAFVILTIYLVVLICSLRKTTQRVNKLLDHLKSHVGSDETRKIIENTQIISSNVAHKMESLNSFFNAFSNVGDYFEQKSDFLRQEAIALSLNEKRRARGFSFLNDQEAPEFVRAAEIVDLIGVGIKIWQRFRN